MSRYGRVKALEEGDYDGAKAAFDHALSIAASTNDKSLEMRALADSGNVDLIDGQFSLSIEKTTRATELAGHVVNPYAEILSRYTAALDHLALGNLAEMRLQASTVLDQAEKLRDHFWLTMALRINEDVAHFIGDWHMVRKLSNRGLALSPREVRSLVTRSVIEYQVGDFVQGEIFLKRLIEVMYETPAGPTSEHAYTAMTIPLIARISSRRDFLDATEFGAGTVMSSPARIGYINLTTRVGLILLAVYNNVDSTVEHCAVVENHRGQLLPFAMTSTDRVLGLSFMTAGRLDQAAIYMEDALVFCRKAGCSAELAWTCCDYANTLLKRRDAGDRDNAMVLLDESLSISTDLGMKPLMERVPSRRDILKA